MSVHSLSNSVPNPAYQLVHSLLSAYDQEKGTSRALDAEVDSSFDQVRTFPTDIANIIAPYLDLTMKETVQYYDLLSTGRTLEEPDLPSVTLRGVAKDLYEKVTGHPSTNLTQEEARRELADHVFKSVMDSRSVNNRKKGEIIGYARALYKERNSSFISPWESAAFRMKKGVSFVLRYDSFIFLCVFLSLCWLIDKTLDSLSRWLLRPIDGKIDLFHLRRLKRDLAFSVIGIGWLVFFLINPFLPAELRLARIPSLDCFDKHPVLIIIHLMAHLIPERKREAIIQHYRSSRESFHRGVQDKEHSLYELTVQKTKECWMELFQSNVTIPQFLPPRGHRERNRERL